MMFGRKSFSLRVSEGTGINPYVISLWLVKSRRGVPEVIKRSEMRRLPSLDRAAGEFLALRDSIVGAGFPEWFGGHDLGPLDARRMELRRDGLSPAGSRRYLKRWRDSWGTPRPL